MLLSNSVFRHFEMTVQIVLQDNTNLAFKSF